MAWNNPQQQKKQKTTYSATHEPHWQCFTCLWNGICSKIQEDHGKRHKYEEIRKEKW